jgi:3-dehydrosphinganine reductase
MLDFANQNVFVTGGSEGIGLAVAKLFCRRGANVFLFARNPEKLAAAAIAVQKAGDGAICRGYPLDVTDAEVVTQVFQSVRNEHGDPDVLVNAAGHARPGLFTNLPPAEFDAMMRVNYLGTVHACRTVIPWLVARGRGHIVNVASLAGLMPIAGYTGYAASKAAVIAFSTALQEEMRSNGVMVSVLCPPDTDTPGYRAENEFKPPETARLSRKCGLLKPKRVADALMAGLKHRQFLIIPGRRARIAAWLQRHCPSALGLFR